MLCDLFCVDPEPVCNDTFVYYETCGPYCPQTCEFYALPGPRVCPDVCSDPGCYCPEGQVVIDGVCRDPEDCPGL